MSPRGDVDGLTLEEIGEQFAISGNRIRQIEAKALRKLKHPARSRMLSWFMEDGGSRSYRYEDWDTFRERRDRERQKHTANVAHIEKVKNSRLPDNLV
jgi:hypothetical protein